MRNCEMFGCKNVDAKMCQIAPGTTVWLCGRCLKELKKEKAIR